MRSSHSRVRRIAYTVSPGSSGGSSCGFSTCPLQSVGQQVIETFWAAQKVSMTCCPTDCNGQVLKPQLEPPLEPGDTVYAILLTLEWEERICTTSTPSQRLAKEAQAQQAHRS